MTLDLKTARIGDVVITHNGERGVIIDLENNSTGYHIAAYINKRVQTYSYSDAHSHGGLDLVQHIPQNEWPTPQTTVPQPTDYDLNGNIQILLSNGWILCKASSYHCFDKNGWAHTPLWCESTPKEKLIKELKVAKDNGTSTTELRILLENTLKYLENEDEPSTSETN